MTKGNISKALEYYFDPEHKWMFGEELNRAIGEFFESKGASLDPESVGHFSEWFLFDYKMQNGKTPLVYFCDSNPFRLPMDALSQYKDMQENVFDVFEVKAVKMNEGFVMNGVNTGREFKVKEKSLTHSAKKNDAVACRIFKCGDHYEIAGGSASLLPSMAPEALKHFTDSITPLNPKGMFHILVKTQDFFDNGLMSAEKIGNDEMLVSGSRIGATQEEYDDCAVCQLMKKAKEEGRSPTTCELEKAFNEVNKHDGRAH